MNKICEINKKLLFISYNLPIAIVLGLCYTVGEERKVPANETVNADFPQEVRKSLHNSERPKNTGCEVGVI